jgi:hypothetical protein
MANGVTQAPATRSESRNYIRSATRPILGCSEVIEIYAVHIKNNK